MNRQKTLSFDFKGFGDFIEIFRAGTHTDASGKKATWTRDDLDQIIANHSADDAAPIVIGHPKDDHSAPAYGWTRSLKRNGDVLFAQFTQVDPAFADLVKNGRFKNRSIRILKGDNGLRLGHVGWLGASPPAVAGLKQVEFAIGGEVFDFSMEWATTNALQKMMRNMREFLIAQFGQEKADAVLPNADIDQLTTLADMQYQDEQEEDAAEAEEAGASGVNFAQRGGVMPQPTQADLDAAKKEAADFAAKSQTLEQQLTEERNLRRRGEFQAIVDDHLKRGVRPAVLEGMADFMLQLDDTDEGVFEFSVGNAKKTAKPLEVVKRLLDALPVTVKPGTVDFAGTEPEGGAADFAAGDGAAVDSDGLVLHQKAVAYQQQHKCDYRTAVAAVNK